jgi:hypothetical protein
MTIRNDIHALRRLIGTPGGECPGVLQNLITAFRFGEVEPEPPFCQLCGEHHWPSGHQVVCEIIVRTREEAAAYTGLADRSTPSLPDCYQGGP